MDARINKLKKTNGPMVMVGFKVPENVVKIVKKKKYNMSALCRMLLEEFVKGRIKLDV